MSIGNITYLLSEPSAWKALVSWPKFSVTSYRLVLSLNRQGIVPRTVIDVGANVGQFTVACVKLFPKVTVHSFEPLPACVKKLQRNVRMFHEVRVYPVALGEHRQEVTFHLNSHSHSSSVLTIGERHRRAFPDAREVEAIKVPMSTLDQEMQLVPLISPTLLKLDVQGYEPQVLNGATETLKSVKFVLLEASFRPLYEGEKSFMEIARTMEDRGFEFLRPLAWLSDPQNGEVLQIDALFTRAADRR